MTDDEAAAVWARCGHRCEARELWPEVECGSWPPAAFHHRRRGSVGRKDNSLDNVRFLCGPHHQAVHDRPALAYERELLLRASALRSDDPQEDPGA